MKVSILVPIYGVEKFIRQCANSLFGQTYENIEYILVDDCTPDNSVKVLEEVLADFPKRQAQVRIVHHEKNRGLGAARKTGMQEATGQLIMFVDSDDYIAPDCVSKMVERLTETGADIVDGAYATFSNDKILNTTEPCQLSDEQYLKAILIHNTVSHNVWGRLFRRALFDNTDISFVEGVNLAEDYAMMARILLKANRTCLNEVVYYYRYNDYGTFADGVSARHIESLLRAEGLVCSYIRKHDKEKTFSTALDIGLLNIYSLAIKTGLGIHETARYCGKPASCFMRGCLLLAKPMHGKLLRWIYLLTKRCYKMFVLNLH